MSSSLLPQLDILDRIPLSVLRFVFPEVEAAPLLLPSILFPSPPAVAVEDRLGRLYRGPTLSDLVVMEELSFMSVVEDEDDTDEEGASPVLLPVFVLLPALLLVASPLEPSPPDVESSLMSLALLLTMLVSSMGRFLLARDDGLASPSAVVPETFLALLFRSFLVFLLRFSLASSFFFRFGLFLLLSFDDGLGDPDVATSDIGAELFDEPRLR